MEESLNVNVKGRINVRVSIAAIRMQSNKNK
jgi:hypothetical protein